MFRSIFIKRNGLLTLRCIYTCLHQSITIVSYSTVDTGVSFEFSRLALSPCAPLGAVQIESTGMQTKCVLYCSLHLPFTSASSLLTPVQYETTRQTCRSDFQSRSKKKKAQQSGLRFDSTVAVSRAETQSLITLITHSSTCFHLRCNRYNLSSHLTNLLGYTLPFDCITESVCEKARFVYNQKHKNESHELNSSHPHGSWTRVHEWKFFCSVSPTTSSICFVTNNGTRICRFRSYQWWFTNYSKFVSARRRLLRRD